MAPSQDVVSRCWNCKKAFAKWQAKHKSILEEKVPQTDRRRIKWIGDYSAVKEVLDAGKGRMKPEAECGLRMTCCGRRIINTERQLWTQAKNDWSKA